MTSTYRTFTELLDFACGRVQLVDGQARRSRLVISACMASLVFAAIWGFAAGSKDFGLATGNLYKTPMVVLLSSLSAIPAGLLALRLTGSSFRPSSILMSFASSIFSGTLVLAVLSPLVGVYYQTSAWAGPYLAMGSVAIALTVGIILFFRSALKEASGKHRRRDVTLSLVVFVIMLGATLMQLVALASPFLPEKTGFSGGIDLLGGVQ